MRIDPNFKDIDEELVLVCIDENKLESEVKFEDEDNCGRYYPHVYGLINNNAVIQVLAFLKDKFGNYLNNEELSEYTDDQNIRMSSLDILKHLWDIKSL